MTLSETILAAALLGTANHPIAPESVLLPATLPPEAGLETQLLLAVATKQLHAQAGYIPPHDHRPLVEPATPEKTSVCSPAAMRYLRLLLSNIHSFAIREWLIAAAQSRRHVGPEMLPQLLLLGLKRPALRPYLVLVLGERGLWLAAEINNQNWKWVFETPEYSLEEVIAFDQWQEAELLAEFYRNTLDELRSDLPGLARYRLVWSDELTEAFLTSLERQNWKSVNGWSINAYANLLTPLAYFFPLDRCAEIQRRITRTPIFGEKMAELIERIQVISDFRRAMLKAIKEEHDE